MNQSLRVETVATLAARLAMSRESVVREVVEGRLPYVNVGGHWRFREKDIDYWLQRHGRQGRLKVIEGEGSV